MGQIYLATLLLGLQRFNDVIAPSIYSQFFLFSFFFSIHISLHHICATLYLLPLLHRYFKNDSKRGGLIGLKKHRPFMIKTLGYFSVYIIFFASNGLIDWTLSNHALAGMPEGDFSGTSSIASQEVYLHNTTEIIINNKK